jgi:WhiB family redox-sensing transcriptional regulator
VPETKTKMALTWTRTFDWDNDAWRINAACRDAPADLFFPVGTTGPAAETIEAAKAVCGACPAREPCLSFALATNQDAGVWGGTTEEERRTMRRAAARSRVS